MRRSPTEKFLFGSFRVHDQTGELDELMFSPVMWWSNSGKDDGNIEPSALEGYSWVDVCLTLEEYEELLAKE